MHSRRLCKKYMTEEVKRVKKWGYIGRFLSAAFDAALSAIVILMLAGLVRGYITGEGFSVLGFRPVAVLTGSMEPAIKTGAIVIVQETGNYEPGDIVMYEDGEVCIIHRYVSDAPDGSIITKGDNNQAEDLRTHTRDEVYGKAVLVMNWVSVIREVLYGFTVPDKV